MTLHTRDEAQVEWSVGNGRGFTDNGDGCGGRRARSAHAFARVLASIASLRTRQPITNSLRQPGMEVKKLPKPTSDTKPLQSSGGHSTTSWLASVWDWMIRTAVGGS